MTHQTEMLTTVVYALVAGVLLMVLARRLRVPAIVPLLLGGIALGPFGLNMIRPAELGTGLRTIVNCAVAIILFEGGLTLDLEGFRKASIMIRRLLTLGVLVTWFATAGILWLIFRFDPMFCLLAGSLVIVTGPTVIIPLLRRLRLQENLHHILLWEGVMIDAVGVFVAVFCFELATEQYSGNRAAVHFFGRFAVGALAGIGIGILAAQVIRRNWIHEELVNLFALSTALLTLAVCEQLSPESGLLGVVLAGFVIAIRAPEGAARIREFKMQLSDLLVGLLFVLLAAKLNLRQFIAYGWEVALAVAAVMFIVRPLNIFVSAVGTGLSVREKLVLSWFAPRGIVAASMASFFSLRLSDTGLPQATFLETFTYCVIFATVVVQGLTIGSVSRWLNLRKKDQRGWLIVGANSFSIELSKLIRQHAGLDVVVVDTNPRLIREAGSQVEAVRADALDPRTPVLLGDHNIGNVMALTDNEDLNVLICQTWSRIVGSAHVYRWASAVHAERRGVELPGRAAWKQVPKPSVISHELETGDAEIIVREEPFGPDSEEPYTLLAVLTPGRFSVDTGKQGKAPGKTQGKTQYVYLIRQANRLIQCLRPELLLTVPGTDFTATVQRMLEVASEHVTELDREQALKDILEREQDFPTSLGNGIAAPHAYGKLLRRHVCIVAHTPDGIDMPTPDNEPVRFLFVVLSPTGDPQGHLMIMGQIAQLASDSETLETLAAAGTSTGRIEAITARFQ